MQIPIGQKRKRGRPKENTPALIAQPSETQQIQDYGVSNITRIDINIEESKENAYPEEEDIQPTKKIKLVTKNTDKEVMREQPSRQAKSIFKPKVPKTTTTRKSKKKI